MGVNLQKKSATIRTKGTRTIGLREPEFFKSLDTAQKSIVDSHLISDSQVDTLINMIQKSWGKCTEMSDPSLRRAIYRYKERFIVPKQADIAIKISAPEMAEKLSSLVKVWEHAINPIESIERVIAIQIARVDKLAKTEEKMPTLMDAQTKNLTALSDMLFKYTQVQMEIGKIKKVAIQHDVSLTTEQQIFLTNLESRKIEKTATMTALAFLEERGHLRNTQTVDADYDDNEDVSDD